MSDGRYLPQCTIALAWIWGGTSGSEQVIQTVASQSNTDASDLPPLFHTLDPDSLDTLIREMKEGEVSFEYAGYNITVNTDGVVTTDEPHSSGGTAKETAGDD